MPPPATVLAGGSSPHRGTAPSSAGWSAVALAIGAAGYHWLEGLPWLDATLNAAMILTGMGPVNPLVHPGAKLFAIGYSLASGVFFLTMVAVLLAPGLQHLLHRHHLELDEDAARPAAEPAGPPAAQHWAHS